MALAKEPEMPADVPVWLMTFSDVITLLMTFFILLLTFATSEPEKFERMQISMFQGGGAMGIAAEAKSPQDLNALLMRKRPKSGRITTRGSEVPPIAKDPTTESLAKGIAGLEEEEHRDLSTTHAMVLPLRFFFASDGSLSTKGKVSARLLARQMRNQPLVLRFSVSDRKELILGQRLASHLYEDHDVRPGRIGVSLNRSPQRAPASIEIRVTMEISMAG